jgi:DNA replication and repair protein RecF
MHLSKLIVSQFRNINLAEIHFSPHVNVIAGDNGSGKTSLLEAVYYLGHAKSFRTPHSTQLISHQEDEFVLYAELDHFKTIGIKRSKTTEQIKLVKQLCQKKSELAKAMPIQIINPDVHKILEDSPRYRRRFLDWGVFHVEHSYWDQWRHYQTILKQRNAALKKQWEKKLVDSWNEELISTVAALTKIKTSYVAELQTELKSIPHDLIDLDIAYQQGWPEAYTYTDSLQKSWELDRKTGFTKYGPHRSDLKITVKGVSAKDIVSRGQQKLLACVLKIAQVRLFRKTIGFSPLFLVDDIFSELDRTASRKVIHLLQETSSQLLITAIEQQPAMDVLQQEDMKMFHVEHGVFQEVI